MSEYPQLIKTSFLEQIAAELVSAEYEDEKVMQVFNQREKRKKPLREFGNIVGGMAEAFIETQYFN